MNIRYRDKYAERYTSYLWLAESLLKKEYKRYDVTLLIEESSRNCCYWDTPYPLIICDPDATYNQEYAVPLSKLITKSRQHTINLKSKKIDENYKRFIDYIISVAHEMGHYKYHKRGRKTIIDMKEYRNEKDFSYRIKVENEAAEEEIRLAKLYGFYDLIR